MKNHIHPLYELPPAVLRGALEMRPGAFDANVKHLLGIFKSVAATGCKEIVLQDDAFRGGDCGSMQSHPVFIEREAKAKAKFLKAFSKIKNAPKIKIRKAKKIAGLNGPTLGADPRFPFCGMPDAVFRRQVMGLARRLTAIGCKNIVLGLSGGLDSALALLVASDAFELLGLPKSSLHVFTMPGFGTTGRTKGNACLLCKGLGIDIKSVNIAPACKRHFADIGHDGKTHDITYENVQARERTQILMDYANKVGGIVVGTGDMSEIALGWSTYNGDHMSMFNVNSGVPKTVVREVCRWYAENIPDGAKTNERLAATALLDILDTPVSPELLPAKDGKITQITEDRVGPYELHDFFIWHFVAGKKPKAEILKLAKSVFKGTYGAATIAKWLDVFMWRIFAQSFKRNCSPDGVKIFDVYFGKDDWRVPSDFLPAKY
jgi:NAD+ synthase (glutamine-hydrolysing)